MTAVGITSIVTPISNEESNPDALFDGTKANVGGTAAQLTVTDTPVKKGVLIKIDSLGGGTYIKFGNSASQNLSFKTVDSYIWIDWIDNLNKIYVKSDGTNATVSWNGG